MIHVIAAIMWIGSSALLQLARSRIEINDETKRKGLEGSSGWCTPGGFTTSEDARRAKVMPKKLHWFAGGRLHFSPAGSSSTSSSFKAAVSRSSTRTSRTSPSLATAIVIAILVGSWFVYDVFWRYAAKNVYFGAACTYAFVVGVLYWLSHHVSGRASFLLTGAMMGTWMATNVWVHIIPRSRVVNAVTTGKPPSETPRTRQDARSRHNKLHDLPRDSRDVEQSLPGCLWSLLELDHFAVLIVVGSSIRHIQNAFKGSRRAC